MTPPRKADLEGGGDLSEGVDHPVLGVGCAGAEDDFTDLGLELKVVEEWEVCLRRLHEPGVRALVLRAPDTARVCEMVREARAEANLVDVLVWAPQAEADEVRDLLQSGAADVVFEDSTAALARGVGRTIDRQTFLPHLQRFKQARSRASRFEGMISRSARMWELFETVVQIAPSGAGVLILGETGVGKELLARAIHKYSGRTGNFVPLNCGSIPESLIDSELFGHEEGTFTGATRSKVGLFRSAEEGTLFLDEIGNLPLNSQYSFLRALQEEAVRPVGGHEEIPIDVRVIAATSIPLDEQVRQGLFREDLLFRLDVVRLEVPPLRERPEDVLHLFGYFRRKLSRHYGLAPPKASEAFLEALTAYHWPGNVRELENLSERLVLTHHGQRLEGHHFKSLERDFGRQPKRRRASDRTPSPRERPSRRLPPASGGASPRIDPRKTLSENLDPVVEDFERRYLERVLEEHRGRIAETAEAAGISPRTLLRKLKKHGIDKRSFRKPR